MPKPDARAQMIEPSWQAAYTDGFRAGLTEAWHRIDQWIARGDLDPVRHSERNGMVMASNLILDPQNKERARK